MTVIPQRCVHLCKFPRPSARAILGSLIVGLLGAPVLGDVVHLKSGQTLEGKVLKQSADIVVFALDYGTLYLKLADIASIDKGPLTKPKPTPAPAKSQAKRLPPWSSIVERLAELPWSTGLAQVPATVVDTGVMRDVPYTSYRCGETGDYEINIYGDPDEPSAIEIGIYGQLADDVMAKRRGLDFIASVLTDPADTLALNDLNLSEGKSQRKDMTYEVTPATAEDAYGAWWVSVYLEKKLDKARASQVELADITVPQEPTPKAPRPTTAPHPRATPKPDFDPPTEWTSTDLHRSRRHHVKAATPSATGRVYVRGYYRKDGTYVRAHTRRRPR